MSAIHFHSNLPEIRIASDDHARLTRLSGQIEHSMPEIAALLSHELDRATVVPPDQVPSNFVRLGSTVTFWDASEQVRRYRLVAPMEADLAAGRLSVLTVLGATLIGLSVGQTIQWRGPLDRWRKVTVLSIGDDKPSGPLAA